MGETLASGMIEFDVPGEDFLGSRASRKYRFGKEVFDHLVKETDEEIQNVLSKFVQLIFRNCLRGLIYPNFSPSAKVNVFMRQ